jgi:uncharacterized protein YcbK (DUF882 family)
MPRKHSLTLTALLLTACATPPAPHDDTLAWDVQRQLVRAPRAAQAPPRLPTGDDFAPGARALDWPLPDDYTPLEQGELEIFSVNLKERLRVRLYSPQGELSEDAAAQLSWLCRDHREDEAHPIDPRLLTLVYLLAQTWQRPVILISGYRKPGRTRASSRHTAGAALDFALPGVPIDEIADLAKARFENVGVGIYPTSDFVHLDVRARSHYWVDHSGPGEKKKEIPLELTPTPPAGSDWTLWSDELPPRWR